LSIANYLTFLRLLISPLFLFIYLGSDALGIHGADLPYLLIMLLGLSELSDGFDGYLARKYNQVTDLGKILDPMADSISKMSVYLAFTQGAVQLSILFVFFIFYRDAVVSTLRTICALKGFTLAARKSGKIKTVIQGATAFCILLLMIPHAKGQLSSQDLHFYSSLLTGIACLYTLYSGADYIIANRQYIKRLLRPNR
jgi:CDP-diacylglycerol--glycerol-3-phosphate 3-phosphatidyltransferase